MIGKSLDLEGSGVVTVDVSWRHEHHRHVITLWWIYFDEQPYLHWFCWIQFQEINEVSLNHLSGIGCARKSSSLLFPMYCSK